MNLPYTLAVCLVLWIATAWVFNDHLEAAELKFCMHSAITDTDVERCAETFPNIYARVGQE